MLGKIKILTIGVAFSFQKHHKLPTNDFDFTLDFIITDKGEHNEHFNTWRCNGIIR